MSFGRIGWTLIDLEEIEWFVAAAAARHREEAACEIVRRAIAGGSGPETPTDIVRDVLELARSRRDHPAVQLRLDIVAVWDSTVVKLESLLVGIEAGGDDAERIAVMLDLVDAVATGRPDLVVVRHTIARVRTAAGVK